MSLSVQQRMESAENMHRFNFPRHIFNLKMVELDWMIPEILSCAVGFWSSHLLSFSLEGEGQNSTGQERRKDVWI